MLIFYVLNQDIVDIEDYKICSPTFVVDEFSGLPWHSPVFSVKHSRFA